MANRNGNTEHIEAYHGSNNETKTFTLSYSLTNAITSYNDVAEFYWKVIGDGWGAKTDSVEVVIHLPDKVLIDQIYVWGHGPLNGMGEIVDGSTAKFSVKNLPAKKFVEVRILFPSSIIVSGPRESKIVLEGIKQDEKSFQEKTVISQRIKVGGLIVLGIILFGWIIFWYRMWYKHGRDYYPGIPKYVHDPPSKLEPALVEALVTQGENITGNAFSATILDLARKKYIKIEAKEKISKGLLGIGVGKLSYGYVLHIDMKRYISKKGLGPFEQQVFDFIFSFSKDGKSIALEDLKKGMRSERFRTREFFKDLKKAVKDEIRTKGFIEESSTKWRTRFVIANTIFLVVIAAFSGWFFGIFEVFFVTVIHLIIFGAIILGLFGNVFLKWSGAVGKQAQEWMSFKRYLIDFSDFENEIPHAVTIWEEMLVYGTALGVAHKVAEYLPLILSQAGVAHASWYYGTSSDGKVSESIAGVSSDFATSFSQSVSDMSSAFSSSFSSGSGGGFSGGAEEEAVVAVEAQANLTIDN